LELPITIDLIIV